MASTAPAATPASRPVADVDDDRPIGRGAQRLERPGHRGGAARPAYDGVEPVGDAGDLQRGIGTLAVVGERELLALVAQPVDPRDRAGERAHVAVDEVGHDGLGASAASR
jgi:hypothetical protein